MMLGSKRIYIYCLLLLLTPGTGQAGALDLLNGNIISATNTITTSLQTTAILWLGSFFTIQLVITNYGLLKSGADLEAVFGKMIGSLLWFGFCYYVVRNGSTFISNVSNGLLASAGTFVGAGGFSASDIINTGATIAANLVANINKASSLLNMFMPALIGGLVGVVILATAGLMAFKVFILKIEIALIVMIAPLSFSFLGLSALKEQGIAPFKSLIALVYRIFIMAALLKSMAILSDNLVSVISSIDSDSIDGIWNALFAAMMAYVLLGFLVFKADSIASSLASGSVGLGSGDVAAAAAMGAAAGAAVASAGTSVAGVGGGAVQSMADVMKNIGGGSGGTVSDASGIGSGGSRAGAPVRPVAPASPFPVNSHGAPVRKEATEAGSGESKTGAGKSAPMSEPGPTKDGIANSQAGVGGGLESAMAAESGIGSDSSADGGDAAPVGQTRNPSSDVAADSANKDAPRRETTGAASRERPATGSGGNAGREQTNQNDRQNERSTANESSPPMGDGSSAGIGKLPEATIDDVMKEIAKQNQNAPQRKSTMDHLKELNQHIAQEKAHTSVTIHVSGE